MLLAGLALLTVGGDTVVRGATGLAKALGVSPLVIGLTVSVVVLAVGGGLRVVVVVDEVPSVHIIDVPVPVVILPVPRDLAQIRVDLRFEIG